eukprot:UN04709
MNSDIIYKFINLPKNVQGNEFGRPTSNEYSCISFVIRGRGSFKGTTGVENISNFADVRCCIYSGKTVFVIFLVSYKQTPWRLRTTFLYHQYS